MKKSSANIIIFILILAFANKASAKEKINDTNLKLSQEIRKDLNIEVLNWNYGKNPIIEFFIDANGKVGNINFIKKKNRFNSQVCANDLILMEPFAQEYRNQVHRYECKPYPELSKKEFKDIKKYTEKYFKQVNAKIKANWFPDPRKSKLRALASFDLYQDGHVANIKFLNSSNDEDFDMLAKKAIDMSAPFSYLDAKAFTFTNDKEKINVLYDFDNRPIDSNQLRPSIGVGTGSYGSGIGFGMGYGSLGSRRWARPYYPGYPYWW